MKKYVDLAMSHPLISGSFIIIAGTFTANLFNFLFNFFMVRSLSLSDYGTLASLISLLTLSSLAASSTVPTVVRFAAVYFAKSQYDMVKGLFFRVGTLSLLLGSLTALIFWIFAREIGQFFRIGNASFIVLTGITILFAWIGMVNTALLQARLAFGFIAFVNFFGAILKFIVGVVFFYLGYSVGGAMWAVFFSFSVPYFVSFIPLTFLFEKGMRRPEISVKELFIYGAPSALTVFGMTSLITADLVLVKHFFDPTSAGVYAGLSLVGKIIYFLSAPIGTVMFPLVVQKHARGEKFTNTFLLALLLVMIPSVSLTIFYFFFPEFSLQLLTKKNEALQATSLVFFMGVLMTLYTLLTVVVNFFLSTKETKVVFPVVLGAIIQMLAMWFYHGSFFQVMLITFVIVSLLLSMLLLYYWRLYGSKNK